MHAPAASAPAAAPPLVEIEGPRVGRWRLWMGRAAPEGEGKAAALLVHAMMATGEYQAPLARSLAARGIDAFVLELRGHGRSAPPGAGEADWCLDDYAREDLPAAIARVREVSPAARHGVGVVGHSLGGLVALAHAAVAPAPAFDRLALVAVCCWNRRDAATRAERLRRDAILFGFSAAARLCGRIPARRFRIGSADEPAGYARQLAGWYRRDAFDACDGTDYRARLGRVRTPVLAVVGRRDPFGLPGDCELLISRLGGPVGRLLVDTGDHFGLYRRPAGRAAWDALAAFLIDSATA